MWQLGGVAKFRTLGMDSAASGFLAQLKSSHILVDRFFALIEDVLRHTVYPVKAPNHKLRAAAKTGVMNGCLSSVANRQSRVVSSS
jgi:hypothetical protein